MQNKIENSETELILSDNVKDILGNVPHIIIRFGMGIIFFILVMMLVLSSIIKYPDVIESTIVITSQNPVTKVLSRTSGRIDVLIVKNGQIVSENEKIMVIENTAKYQDVVKLKSFISSLEISLNGRRGKLPSVPDQLVLGPIQSTFANFYSKYNQYVNTLSLDIYAKKIESTEYQIKDYTKLVKRQKEQLSNTERILDLARVKYLRDSILFTKRVLSQSEFDTSEQALLAIKNNLITVRSTINNTQLEMNKIPFQMLDLKSQKQEIKSQMINLIRESIITLKTVIGQWENEYVISSPTDGKVNITNFWAKNQFVTEGTSVCTITPKYAEKIIGKIRLPTAGAGKVRTGQSVVIKLDNYPYIEFGTILGRIGTIATLPETDSKGQNAYVADVTLPEGLLTSYKIKVEFTDQLQGTSEVITKKNSILDRFIQPFKSAYIKSVK